MRIVVLHTSRRMQLLCHSCLGRLEEPVGALEKSIPMVTALVAEGGASSGQDSTPTHPFCTLLLIPHSSLPTRLLPQEQQSTILGPRELLVLRMI